MIHVIFGEDTYRAARELARVRAECGRAAVTRLDGASVTLGVLTSALRTPSLLDPQQLVICTDLMRLQKKKTAQAEIAAWLTAHALPAHAILVFVENGSVPPTNPVRKALAALDRDRVRLVECAPLQGRALDTWASEQIAAAGCAIDRDALQALVGAVGQDLWKLAQEIDKLAAYAWDRSPRAITAPDVRELVHAQVPVNIFDFVDALGQKQTRRALELLHNHLDAGEEPLYLLSMMVYQFRNLLKVKSLLDAGRSPREIATAAKLHPFVAGKTAAQAQKFSLPALLAIHAKLHDADVRLKQGRLEPQLMLDSFVVAVCR